MSIKNYMKRLIKYVIYDSKQPIIYANIVQKESNKILKDKIILVTGGGSGLGYYISKKLIEEGATVIITGRNEEKLKKVKEKLGESCFNYECDVTDLKKNNELLDNIYMKYGKLDALINNAGISLHEKDFLDVTQDGFNNQISTNFKASYFLSQYYIKKYKEYNQKEGNIVFISSERGSQCDYLPYGLTKAAINSFTQGLSRKYYKEGIRINAVGPGVTASNMTGINKNDDLYSENAAGRFFVPEEIAEVVLFLLSEFSKCISGEIINCDAGEFLNPWFK